MGRPREPRGRITRSDVPVAGSYTVWSGEARLVRDRDRRNAWTLTVDGCPQSHVDLDDATYLAFDYMQHIGIVVDRLDEPGRGLDAVHIGGGACTLPRYVAVTRPGSRQIVFEPDGGMAELAREQLALRGVPRLRVRVTEGRSGMAGRPDDSADIVVVDAFDRGTMPSSLATVQFVRDVARVLRDAGTYVLNLADGSGLSFARRVAATVGTVFEYVGLLAEPGVLRGRHFGNLIVVAGCWPPPFPELARDAAGAAFPARLVAGADLSRFCGRAAPITDGEPITVPVPPETWRVGR